MPTPKPSRHFRLVCWRLLYGLEVQKTLSRQEEIRACKHARLDLKKWDQEKARCPREWEKLLAKRKRRLAWFKQHGSIDDGWTPPDPKDPRRTAYRPLHAYLAHQGLTVETAYAKYSKFDTSHFQTKHHLEVLARLWNWT